MSANAEASPVSAYLASGLGMLEPTHPESDERSVCLRKCSTIHNIHVYIYPSCWAEGHCCWYSGGPGDCKTVRKNSSDGAAVEHASRRGRLDFSRKPLGFRKRVPVKGICGHIRAIFGLYFGSFS